MTSPALHGAFHNCKASDQPAAYLYGVVDWELLGAGAPEGHRSAADRPHVPGVRHGSTRRRLPSTESTPTSGSRSPAPGHPCKFEGHTSRAPPDHAVVRPAPAARPADVSRTRSKMAATCRRGAPAARPRTLPPPHPTPRLTPLTPPLTARRSRCTATRAAPSAASRRRRRPSSTGPTTPSTSRRRRVRCRPEGTAGARTARRRGSPRTAAVAASSTSC